MSVARKHILFQKTAWAVAVTGLFLIFYFCAYIEFSVFSQDAVERGSESDASSSEEKISMDFKGIDLIEIFRMFSLKTGLTIVPSKGVRGRINLFLNNVTFNDALDVILITQGLACERKGNILMVMTEAEYKKRYGKKYDENRRFRDLKLTYAKPAAVFSVLSKLKSEIGKVIADEASGIIILLDIPEKLDLMEKVVNDLDRPLRTEIFSLNYADSNDVKNYLANVITSGTGELIVDAKTNKVIVTDLPEKIKKIKNMINAFDEESRQVFIEAEILQITLKDEFQRGINWEKVFSEMSAPLTSAGTFPASPSFSPSPELAASNIKMSVGTLDQDDYTATLQLLESFGDAKTLSRPRIMVMNNEEAKILVGAREAYVTQSMSQAETTTVTSESVEFIDVGVKLNITPTINKDGFVIMKVRPEVSSVRETLATALGSNIPIVETSEVETSVKVKDGAIIMIAGLMKEERREDIAGIPILSKIPILGTLFGSRAKLKKKTELVIFLRPRIVSGEVPLPGHDFERVIPPSVLPEEIVESILLKEIENIGAVSRETYRDDDNRVLPDKNAAKEEQAEEQAEKQINRQRKGKGFKEY